MKIGLSSSGVLALGTASAFAVAGVLAYLWWQKNRDRFKPKSEKERQVDSLYGPDQEWKTHPVYNEPGQPGYIPNLPESHPPKRPSGERVKKTKNPPPYIGPPGDLPVGIGRTEDGDIYTGIEQLDQVY